MKDVIKAIEIFIVAMFISIIIYPFLHEFGHFIIAILFGVRVIEVKIFPIPSVMYINNNNIGNIQTLLIGFGGIILPIIISINIRTKKFWIWYANFILKSICLLSLIISILSIIFEKSKIFEQDDMRKMLILCQFSKELFLVFNISIFIMLSFHIYKKDICKYGFYKQKVRK